MQAAQRDAKPVPPVRPPEGVAGQAAARAACWRANRRITLALLAVWAVFGLGLHWFARDLQFSFFGWPFSFWMAAQGSLLVFAGVIAVYARAMERLEAEHGLGEGQD